MRTRKVKNWLVQVVAEAGLGLRSDASDWSFYCPVPHPYVWLLCLLMSPRPSGDVPASKRPPLRPHTHPSIPLYLKSTLLTFSSLDSQRQEDRAHVILGFSVTC